MPVRSYEFLCHGSDCVSRAKAQNQKYCERLPDQDPKSERSPWSDVHRNWRGFSMQEMVVPVGETMTARDHRTPSEDQMD